MVVASLVPQAPADGVPEPRSPPQGAAGCQGGLGMPQGQRQPCLMPGITMPASTAISFTALPFPPVAVSPGLSLIVCLWHRSQRHRPFPPGQRARKAASEGRCPPHPSPHQLRLTGPGPPRAGRMCESGVRLTRKQELSHRPQNQDQPQASTSAGQSLPLEQEYGLQSRWGDSGWGGAQRRL